MPFELDDLGTGRRYSKDVAQCTGNLGDDVIPITLPMIIGPDTASIGATVTLTAYAVSLLADSTLLTFDWTLPNGTVVSKPAARSRSTITVPITGAAGDHLTVTVAATDSQGNRSVIDTHVITVAAPLAPIVSTLATNIPVSIGVGETATGLSIHGATDPSGGTVSYALTMPLGLTASKTTGLVDNEEFSVTAAEDASTTSGAVITIRVTTSNGGNASVTRTVAIVIPITPPMIIGPDTALIGATVTLTAYAVSLLAGGSITAYVWVKPDGSTEIKTPVNGNSTITYLATGATGDTFTSTVYARDNTGNQSSVTVHTAMLAVPVPPDVSNLTTNIPVTITGGEIVNGLTISGATDPNGGTVTYALSLPAGLTASKITGLTNNEVFTMTASNSVAANPSAIISITVTTTSGTTSVVNRNIAIAVAPQPTVRFKVLGTSYSTGTWTVPIEATGLLTFTGNGGPGVAEQSGTREVEETYELTAGYYKTVETSAGHYEQQLLAAGYYRQEVLVQGYFEQGAMLTHGKWEQDHTNGGWHYEKQQVCDLVAVLIAAESWEQVPGHWQTNEDGSQTWLQPNPIFHEARYKDELQCEYKNVVVNNPPIWVEPTYEQTWVPTTYRLVLVEPTFTEVWVPPGTSQEWVPPVYGTRTVTVPYTIPGVNGADTTAYWGNGAISYDTASSGKRVKFAGNLSTVPGTPAPSTVTIAAPTPGTVISFTINGYLKVEW